MTEDEVIGAIVAVAALILSVTYLVTRLYSAERSAAARAAELTPEKTTGERHLAEDGSSVADDADVSIVKVHSMPNDNGAEAELHIDIETDEKKIVRIEDYRG